MNQNDVILSYNFRVSAAGSEWRVSKVRNIEQSVEVEEVREGGCNEYVHALIKPTCGLKKLSLERGLCSCKDSLALESLLGVPQNQPLLINVYDRRNTTILKTYQVEGWMLVKWQLSELNAGTGGVLLESAEVVYHTLKNGS